MKNVSICRQVAIAMRGRKRAEDCCSTGIYKGSHCYFFLYLPTQRAEALCAFGRHAENPSLNFDWLEASALSQELRRQERAAQRPGGRLRGRA